MRLPVVLRAEAEADADADSIREFLDCTSEAHRKLFERDFRALLERIENMPESFGVISRGVRAGLIGKSKYVVFFRILLTCIEVLAVAHGARSYDLWKTRLRKTP